MNLGWGDITPEHNTFDSRLLDNEINNLVLEHRFRMDVGDQERDIITLEDRQFFSDLVVSIDPPGQVSCAARQSSPRAAS